MTTQYLKLCKEILDSGEWVYNDRTGKNCLVKIHANFEYNVGAGEFPLVTTRKSFWKAAAAELLGYIRGYDNAQQFTDIGSPTWEANANENDSWLANKFRKGHGDMGRVYGVQGREWARPDGIHIDQLRKVINNLSEGIDDRSEIISFWNVGEMHMGCLKPCMFMHHFSLVNGTLHLHSYQRSIDVPLGLNFNMVQVYTLLALVAQITGNKPGIAYHTLVNCHLYEDQVELMKEQVKRAPYKAPTFHINPSITCLEDLETWVTVNDFFVEGYEHHPAIKYPFSV